MTVEMKKTLFIPYLPELDSRPSHDAVAETLARHGAKAPIAEINWADYPERPEAYALVARSDRSLYLYYNNVEWGVRATYTEDGSPVYQDSCVEFFMRKEGDETYMNFEFNAIGTCDAARRESRERSQPLSAEELARIRRWPSLGREPVSVEGEPTRWTLLVEIPFQLMGLDPSALPAAVEVNFYKCGDMTSRPHYLSWSPIGLPAPNFHCPAYFGIASFR